MPDQDTPTRTIASDEPTSVDALNREDIAEAFARLAMSCETPLVIGLYGTWGIGKTSLMMLIESKLKKLDSKDNIKVVWFDPWRHQFDEHPVVALIHTLYDSIKGSFSQQTLEKMKKLLTIIAASFGSGFMKKTFGINDADIDRIAKRYEDEQFQLREWRVRLYNHFSKLIEAARRSDRNDDSKRIIFFIDDLDRCMPEEALKLLEALKLYLNQKGCVYFLGVDRDVVERWICHCYKDCGMEGNSYLDKIVQLPFTVPPIEKERLSSFISPLLPAELQECADLLADGLGDNPRRVKRFVNAFLLNHQLAIARGVAIQYPEALALILLIQLRQPGLYKQITKNPNILNDLKTDTEFQNEGINKLYEDYLGKDERLRNAVQKADLPESAFLKEYIHLAAAAEVPSQTQPVFQLFDQMGILRRHQAWLKSKGKLGERANFSRADLNEARLMGSELSHVILYEADLRGANLIGAILVGANLSEADLREADLCEANLKGADLSGANLTEADITRADLTGADLTLANLKGADLREARVSLGALSKAVVDETTIMPDGTRGTKSN